MCFNSGKVTKVDVWKTNIVYQFFVKKLLTLNDWSREEGVNFVSRESQCFPRRSQNYPDSPGSVDGSHIRKEKVADSKISGYVCTDP